MKKFYWVHKDYNNESLNSLARRVTEYNTADLLADNFQVCYTETVPTDGSDYAYIGKLQIVGGVLDHFPYTVEDIHIVNDIFNYNLFFKQNTEDQLIIPNEMKGTFDCLVSLAAGQMVEMHPKEIGLATDNHYIIDISPTAIHQTMNLYKDVTSQFELLDIFNIDHVKEFLKKCKGTCGLFVVSNCFNYIVSSLLYDVEMRLHLQNKFIQALIDDDKEWYVTIFSADGSNYSLTKAEDISNKQLNTGFEVLPWIKK